MASVSLLDQQVSHLVRMAGNVPLQFSLPVLPLLA
jgi:hypothetical protein